jgi:hypothetical protein
MSKLTEYLAESGWDNPNLKEAVLELLPAHDAEIREQAKREQMEADCKVACWACHEKDAPVYIGGGEWVHEDRSIESDDVEGDTCEASAIRAAWAKAHLELLRFRAETERVDPLHGWIPVSERLPDGERFILALWHAHLGSRGVILELLYTMRQKLPSYVTHWRELPPLPEMPKKEAAHD